MSVQTQGEPAPQWIANRYGDEMQMKIPQFIGNWYGVGGFNQAGAGSPLNCERAHRRHAHDSGRADHAARPALRRYPDWRL